VLNFKMKTLAAGVSAAIMMACVPSHASNIRVVVAPAFFKTANAVAGAFTGYYLSNHSAAYNVTVVSQGDSNAESTIISGGATGPYDIFLSSGPVAPYDLYVNYASLVGTPFGYAVDTLELYSPSIDVTGGLPYPLTTDFIMPDPANDSVGQMAALVLAVGPWHILPNQIPGGHVFTTPTAGTSLVLIKGGSYPYGFVGRSQICTSAAGVLTYPAGSYHHSYAPPGGTVVPTPLHFTAVSVNRTRDTPTETELQDFIAFLKGATSSFGDAPTRGTDAIQRNCFQLPTY
jgi:molybdate transport system substrate-binding protein